VIISSAVVSAIGTGGGFKQGRDFAAWLGLVPKKFSTGGPTKLAGLSKRGNSYMRTLFVQAAHVVLIRKPAAAQAALWPSIELARQAHDTLYGCLTRLRSLRCAIRSARKPAWRYN
jgi:transposase